MVVLRPLPPLTAREDEIGDVVILVNQTEYGKTYVKE